MLPFTPEVFLSLFAQYNAAIWPAQLAAYPLGLAALLFTVWPRPGSGRLIAAALAAFWLWTGVAYHLSFFATINFAAPFYGALFVLQAILLAWRGACRGRLSFRFHPTLAGWAGLALAVYALAIHPLIGWVIGRPWSQAAMFGVTPSPVTIFTLGLLMLAERRNHWLLTVIPLLWSLVGGTAAWLLEVPEDLAMVVAAVAVLALMPWKNRLIRAQCG